jgi:methylglutaconyl-CoA hydratase
MRPTDTPEGALSTDSADGGRRDVLTAVREDGVATVTMNRPDVHNAFDDVSIASLAAAFRTLGGDPSVRCVVLRGAGAGFSAGADLAWMQRMAGYSRDENLADAAGLAGLMQAIDRCPKPVVAAVHGPAFGGGVGLVACCDVAVASDAASFALTEVRLGLIPAVISPYVVAAIGERAARRYFLTAERMSAVEAHRLGLVHEVVPGHMLDAAVERMLSRLREGSPHAQAAAKDLIAAVARRPTDAEVVADTAARIADQRASAAGKEGLAAFLAKRKPSWAG